MTGAGEMAGGSRPGQLNNGNGTAAGPAADTGGDPAAGEPVRYERRGPVALVTLNRPRYRNAQNSAMTYALDAAFARATSDDEVKVIVLAGAGTHFCAGHDIGSPGRDAASRSTAARRPVVGPRRPGGRR